MVVVGVVVGEEKDFRYFWTLIFVVTENIKNKKVRQKDLGLLFFPCKVE